MFSLFQKKQELPNPFVFFAENIHLAQQEADKLIDDMVLHDNFEINALKKKYERIELASKIIQNMWKEKTST